MKAIRVRLAVLFIISSILMVSTPFPAGAQMCQDVDGNGSYNVLDFTYLLGYLWKNGPAPGNPE